MGRPEEIIRAAMLKIHITNVKDLAERCGLEPATLRKNLKSPGSMSIGRLRVIAETTNMSPEEIAAIVRATPMR